MVQISMVGFYYRLFFGGLNANLTAIQHLASSTAGDSCCYVCCAETHKLKSGNFQLIVCMSVDMSFWLIRAKCLSVDMSFKRVSGKWEEFEIETWDDEYTYCTLFSFTWDC